MIKKIPLLVLALICALATSAQEKLSSEQLQQDLQILGEITVGISPKITDEDRLRIMQLVQEQKTELEGQELTALQFFNFLTAIDFDTKFDEHASLGLTKELLQDLLTKSQLFPLPIQLVGTDMVVNTEQAEIPFGSKIIAINGQNPDSLLNTFSRKYDDTFVKRNLEGSFPIIYRIKVGGHEKFDLLYQAPNSTEKQRKTLSGIDFKTYKENQSKTEFPLKKEALQNLINTQFHEKQNTYYLQLNSFNWDLEAEKQFVHGLRAEHKNFDKKFQGIFDDIAAQGAEHLIIDLRYNSGGNVKVPGVLYQYIAQKAFTEDVVIRIQDFDLPHTELVEGISGREVDNPKAVRKFVKRYKRKFELAPDSGFVWNFVEQEERKPAANAFQGKVYLLVGGRSVSASAYFAALYKSDDRGLVYGEEMGGSYRSLSAGKILSYQLPNSKIKFNAPVMEVNFSERLYQVIQQDRVQADVELKQADQYRYFLQKKDATLESLLEAIGAESR